MCKILLSCIFYNGHFFGHFWISIPQIHWFYCISQAWPRVQVPSSAVVKNVGNLDFIEVSPFFVTGIIGYSWLHFFNVSIQVFFSKHLSFYSMRHHEVPLHVNQGQNLNKQQDMQDFLFSYTALWFCISGTLLHCNKSFARMLIYRSKCFFIIHSTLIHFPECLKAEKALEWVGRMNNIRACAMEIVNEEIIFA